MSEELNVAILTSNPVGFLAKSADLWLNATTHLLETYNPSNYVLGKYVIAGTRVGSTPIVSAQFPGGPGTIAAPVSYDILPVEAIGGTTHAEGDPAAGGMFTIRWNGGAITEDPDPLPITGPISLALFKDTFDRDFIYGIGMDSVRDKDITRAFAQATSNFNDELWSDVVQSNTAFLLCAAHFVALTIQAAGGLAFKPTNAGVDSEGSFVIQQKGVGPLSASYVLPDKLQNDPILYPFLRTAYGQQYLQMVIPQLVGAMFIAPGWNDVNG